MPSKLIKLLQATKTKLEIRGLGDCEWVDLKTTFDREAIKNLILDRIADYGAGTINILDLPDILADEIMILLEERK